MNTLFCPSKMSCNYFDSYSNAVDNYIMEVSSTIYSSIKTIIITVLIFMFVAIIGQLIEDNLQNKNEIEKLTRTVKQLSAEKDDHRYKIDELLSYDCKCKDNKCCEKEEVPSKDDDLIDDNEDEVFEEVEKSN
jgi:hypothetical protein